MNWINKIFEGKTAKATLLLAFFSIIAKLAGLWRDRVLASTFGASSDLDVYYSAFKIPDLIFNLIVAGALSAAFIPVFTERYRSDKKSAWQLGQNFLNIIFLAVALLSALAFIFARPLAHLVSPGFDDNTTELLASVLRIMLLSPIIFSLSAVMGSMLQALERFVAYSIAPILYNIGIIGGALYLVPIFQRAGYPAVYGLAWGVVVGALMHFLVQAPHVILCGFRFGKLIDFGDVHLRKIAILTIPRMLATGASSIQALMLNIMASFLGAGSIVIFNLANNLHFVPVSIIGISAATAVFSKLSYYAAGKEKDKFAVNINRSLISTFWLTLPVAIVGWIFRQEIIRALFAFGNFDSQSAVLAGDVLGIFMTAVVAQSLIAIVVRGFYALSDTRTPLLVGLVALAINVLLAVWFAWGLNMQVVGLALAYSVASNVQFIALLYLLKSKQ